MIQIIECTQKPDLFNGLEANVPIGYKITNELTKEERQETKAPKNLKLWKEKQLRKEVIRAARKLHKARMYAFQNYEANERNYKWECVLMLDDKFREISAEQDYYDALRFINSKMIWLFDHISPSTTSRFYKGYQAQLSILKQFILKELKHARTSRNRNKKTQN